MKDIRDYTIKELLAMGYRVELHRPPLKESSGVMLHVQEPTVSANRGQGNFTDKGENK